MTKDEIIKKFNINSSQEKLLNTYIFNLKKYNKHTNLVGNSTLEDPWKRHVLDCLQILPTLNNYNHSILDMGTGAGFPGLILSIMGCKNVTLVDSNNKKIKFVENLSKKLNLSYKTSHERIENLNNKKYDFVVSRALANLNKLFFYSQNLVKDNTVLIFLKGKNVKNEISEAKKKWKFFCNETKSLSNKQGMVLKIEGLIRND